MPNPDEPRWDAIVIGVGMGGMAAAAECERYFPRLAKLVAWSP